MNSYNVMSTNGDIKVSVIIPVYNTSEFLRECLESVVYQTLSDIEIITVNDCSTDNSQQIIDEFSANDSRFRKVIHEVNKGLPSARNSGVSVARGKYIIHLDSDDYWIRDDALELLYDTAEGDGCEILRFNGIRTDSSPSDTIFKGIDVVSVNLNNNPFLWEFKSVFLFFFRKDFLDLHDVTFEPTLSIGEDAIYLSLVLPKARTISSISDSLYAYRINDSSMMRANWTISHFLEEQKAFYVTTTNLRSCQGAWLKSWQFRLDHYWPKQLMTKAFERLNERELRLLISEFINISTSKEIEMLLGHSDTSPLARKFLGQMKTNGVENIIELNSSLMRSSIGLFGKVKAFIKRSEFISSRLISLYHFMYRWNTKSKNFIKQEISKARHRPLHKLSNLEGLEEFDIELSADRKTDGVSAMLRVKNEEDIILNCLESIVTIFDEIIIIDNDSTDRTIEKINEFVGTSSGGHKIKIFSYPFFVAKCGSEHQNTPAESVHSLSYYYNWCLSKCRRKAVFKWDADMILSSVPGSIEKLKTYLNLFSRGQRRYGEIRVQTVYIDDNRKIFLATSEVNKEVRVFKNSPKNHFQKGAFWEVLKLGRMVKRDLEDILVYELKDTNKNEFNNWSDQSFTTERKVKEFRNYRLVQRRRHLKKGKEFKFLETI